MRGRNRKPSNPLNRVYESNGPDVKVRGAPNHVAEKYMQLARDANASGDYISAENYLQHAEHYFRIIAGYHEQMNEQRRSYRDNEDNQDGAEGDNSSAGHDASNKQNGADRQDLSESPQPRIEDSRSDINDDNQNEEMEADNKDDNERGEREKPKRNPRSGAGRRLRAPRKKFENNEQNQSDGDVAEVAE